MADDEKLPSSFQKQGQAIALVAVAGLSNFNQGLRMEDKQVFKKGDRVEQLCLTCNEERGHVVASVTKNGKISRVSCPICGSRVPYKAGTTRRASLRAGAPYDSARTYRRGQTILHPTFGEGEVTAIDSGKMDVLFADRMRRLIHSQV